VPVGRTVARALAGAAGTVLGLRLAGRTTAPLGPLEVAARVSLSNDGGVRVDIPPLGTATFRTHRGPLRVTATATGVEPSRAQGLLAVAPDQAAATELHAQLDRAVAALGQDGKALAKLLATRTVIASLAGAAATAALALRRPRDVLGASGAALGLLAGVGGLAAATARRDALRTPELDGLLTKAPLLLGDLRTAPDRIATYRDQLAELLETGTNVYRKLATLPEPPPADALRLLHISDIHLSPLAYPLTKALVDDYRVDAVIDTGDLVDWGTPPEQLFARQIAALGVPYVFVKGNHDSSGIAAAVAEQPNAIVLDVDTAPVEVAGLRFAGMADPRFTADKTTGDDHAAHRVSEVATKFATAVTGQGVDVLLAHDPAAGRALAGTAPLLLAGHTHKRSVRRFGDTVVLVQGTTGGSGLRGVQQDPTTPVSLSVLYIDRTTKRLHSVDEVTLGGLGSVSLNVVRRAVADLMAMA
jgi:predicted MPP superfamily phosphohydrolase